MLYGHGKQGFQTGALWRRAGFASFPSAPLPFPRGLPFSARLPPGASVGCAASHARTTLIPVVVYCSGSTFGSSGWARWWSVAREGVEQVIGPLIGHHQASQG